MAKRSGGLVKANTQWTPEQYEWLQNGSERLGLRSASAFARMVVQAAMVAAEGKCLQCPQHCGGHAQ